jgi:hypothetical protein
MYLVSESFVRHRERILVCGRGMYANLTVALCCQQSPARNASTRRQDNEQPT